MPSTAALVRPLVWFRADLRVSDNLALARAIEAARGAKAGGAGDARPLEAVFLLAPEQWRSHDWGDPRTDFVLRTLRVLAEDLAGLGIPLRILEVPRFDRAADALVAHARARGLDSVWLNREYELNEVRRDEAVERACDEAGLGFRAFHDQVILPPDAVKTGEGRFYSVFTPYRKSWMKEVRERGIPSAQPRPEPIGPPVPPAERDEVPVRIAGFDPAGGKADHWPAGELEAQRRLARFADGAIAGYADGRDFPGIEGTSRLSPYLAVGAISPRQCLDAARAANAGRVDTVNGAGVWITELVWREFYRHVITGWPRVCTGRAFRLDTDRLDWRRDEDEFAAWCEGRTGFPIVDAAMRQLAETGWMHNRLRMITAMFLTKDLYIDWRWGERFFMRSLVDGDFASNNGGWQWSASSGTDAAPYFRIFNPFSQGKKFDPSGDFVRAWVPELRGIEGAKVHEPHAIKGGLFGSLDYPTPIVDHAQARERVLAAFKALKAD